MIVRILKEQLHQPPDRRIRLLLMAMSGLMAYLIVDAFQAHTNNAVSEIKDSLHDIQNDIVTANALIEQIPALRGKVETLRGEQASLQEWKQNGIEQITQCREKDVLQLLQQFSDANSPFAGFNVRTSNKPQGLKEIVYAIRLQGRYEDILQAFLQIDRSVCVRQIGRWELFRSNDESPRLEGSIQLHVFRTQESGS